MLSLNAELGFILNNISALGKYIYVEDVMPRAFSDSSWVHSYCESSAFAFAVIESKERLSTNYNANKADYQWSIELIDWHEKWALSHGSLPIMQLVLNVILISYGTLSSLNIIKKRI